jgi:hypothetical protein
MFADGWSSLRESLNPVLSNAWVFVLLAVALLAMSVLLAFKVNTALEAFRAGRFPPWVYRLTGHKRRHTRALHRERRNQPAAAAEKR